ncbi:MAG TPA: AAA family ATPase [Solirubrobacterales bacterium]|nr:AAA family ATPase [Solirubrobacterales bacterium]
MLLERERELGEVEAALDALRGGRGSALAIEAEAGLGKTRLLQEARRIGAEAGLDVLWARATDLERESPFALVRQLFESRLTGLSPAEREQVLEGATAALGALGLDPGGDRESDSFAVLHGLYWVTAAMAERRPLLLAVDDAHLADAGSLDYFGFLLPRLEELPVLLILTARPNEPDPSGGLGRILTDASTRHVSPGPLSVEATGAILEQELGRVPQQQFATACQEVSGGNPFLLSELARTIAEREIGPVAEQAELVRELAPERVARTVLNRIDRLSAEAGRLARSLAVFGDGSEQRLVAELAEVDPDQAPRAADELRARSILDGDASLRFIHPLVRNAVYADIPAGERSQAHARAAALLRERDASPERISTQLLASEGREDVAAVETLVEAAKRAVASGAPRSAVAYLSRALQEPPPVELRPAVLRPLISASLRAADLAAWAEIEPDVRAELERDPALRSDWAIPLTLALGFEGRFEEAGSLLKDAVDVAVAEGDVERAFQLEAQLRTISMVVPTLPEVDLSRYADQIDPSGPAGRLAAAMESGMALGSGTAAEAAEAARRALADGAIFFEETELVAATLAVTVLVIADDLSAAREAVDRAHVIAQERNGTPELVRSWFCRGFVAWGEGDLVAAEADMRQAADLSSLAGMAPAALAYRGHLIEMLIERDELEEAEATMQAAGMATGPVPENLLFTVFLVTRTHLRFEQGDMEAAAEDFETLARQGEGLGLGDGPLAVAGVWGTRALLATGKREQAREMADRAMSYARHWGTPGFVAHGMCAVAAARGGAEEIELLEEAAAMADGALGPIVRAQALLELGRALRRDGRRAEARGPLREVLELARRRGMARAAKHAREELQATGETVRRYAPIGVESLTPSERRVAELAASGMTNRQIAQSLFVTVKTVEAHLSAAYDKLDIESRRQLPAALEDGASAR